MTREVTNKILELVDEGVLDAKHVLLCCLKYMSEDDVADMVHVNELGVGDDEESDDEDQDK